MSDDTVRGLVAKWRKQAPQLPMMQCEVLLSNADELEQALAQPAASEVGEPVAHRFQGSCPDELQPTARDPLCAACTPPAPAAGDGLPELPVSEDVLVNSVLAAAGNRAHAERLARRIHAQMFNLRDAAFQYGRQLGRASR